MEKEKPKFNREAFKKAIAQIESQGGKLLDNPNSSAAGRYHFLYRYIKDAPLLKGVSKREFINSPDLQEKVMDMAIDGTLPGFPSYEKNSYKLKAKYNTNLRHDEIAALTHFLGVGGVEKYLSGPDNFKVPGQTNATVSQYVDRFNDAQGTDPSYKNGPREFTQNANNPKIPIDNSLSRLPVGMDEHFRDTTDRRIESTANIDFDSEAFRIAREQDESVDPVNSELNSATIPADETLDQQGVRLSGFLENKEFALGGNMEGDATGEFTEFEGGGTHKENPLGGIPQGMGDNGKLNTVEEGESKYSFDDGDYVFSNRITL